jgi:hypothetical protein
LYILFGILNVQNDFGLAWYTLGKIIHQWKTCSVCEQLASKIICSQCWKLAFILFRAPPVILMTTDATSSSVHLCRGGGVFLYALSFSIPRKMSQIQIRRIWWPRPSIGKISREVVWDKLIAKILIWIVLDCICCVELSHILLDGA